jgi:predicted PurR-regulated permease PerM
VPFSDSPAILTKALAADQKSLAAFACHVLVAIALVVIALLLWRAADVILLALGAVVVAILLRACAEPIARHTPLSESWAVAVTTLVLLLVLVLVGWLVGAETRAQLADLVDRLPAAWQSLQERLGVQDLGRWATEHARDAASGAGGMLSSLTGAVTALGSALANLALVVIGGVFLAARPDLYRTGLLKLVPGEQARERLGDTFDAAAPDAPGALLPRHAPLPGG